MGPHPDDGPSRSFLKDRGSPDAECSEPTYNGIYPDGCLSSLADYMGLHHNGNSSGSLLKDGSLLIHDVRSQSIIGYTSMAARAVSQLIWVFTVMATPWEPP